MTAPRSDHPLLAPGPEVRFDALDPADVVPLFAEILGAARAEIARIGALTAPGAPPVELTYEGTLGALEAVELRVERSMGLVRHLEDAATTPAWRAAYNAVHPEVAALSDGLPLDAALYRTLSAYAATPAAAALEPVRARHLRRTLDAFRREGAELQGEAKARLEAVNRALSELTSKFAQNVVDATAAYHLHLTAEGSLDGLPPSAVEAARAEAARRGVEGVVLTLQMPCYQAVQMFARDATLRETLYRAYNRRATAAPHDNVPLVDEILRLRREKAALLGFENYADLVVADRMARTGARARAFVADLQTRTATAFEAEAEALLAYRRELEGPSAPALAPWDLAYYARQLQAARYAYDEEALRPYFPAERVLSGAFELFRRLYGVTTRPRPDLSTWDPGVSSYELTDADGAPLGIFHVDLFPRANKRDGAWMNPLRTSPPGVAHLGLIAGNMSPPQESAPALLRFSEVETVFHELGHLLHHLLSRVPVLSLSGTAVAWDFVELPSQIHENFCYAPEVLDLITAHHQTGASLPEADRAALRRARTFRAATAQMRQLAFAELDLTLHVDYEPARDGDVLSYARRILQRGTPAPLPDDHAMVAAFGHLFASPVGYSAGYYSYKWAEVLDADAFETLAPGERIDGEAGRRFRDTLLSQGNSAPPESLFEAFVGRPPALDPLLRRAGLIA